MNEDNEQWVIERILEASYIFDNDRKLHCETGPAVVFGDGTEEYWLNGEKIGSKEEWERLVKLKALW